MDADLFTLEDCTRAGYCPSGIVKWCRTSGINPREFLDRLKEGIPRGEVEVLDDGMIQRALELKDAAASKAGT